MMAQANRQQYMKRRSFLGRMAAMLGLPLAVPAGMRNQPDFFQPTPGQPMPDLPTGFYYRRGSADPQVADVLPELNARTTWHRQARIPIWESTLGNEPIFIEAIRREEVLYGSYHRWGDSTIRRISPIQLFQLEPEDPLAAEDASNQAYYHDVIDTGPNYLLAWDHDRHASRTFRAEYFAPLFTAPWMQRYAGELSQQAWKQLLGRTEHQLRQRGIQPVANHA
ncbi:MAG: hypothetical protein EA353_11005 [Puniceicoccaceae bacterium]|nr:MAG: hypothetical protein EA353_11005 [Puniceicoccaceae bacterium]